MNLQRTVSEKETIALGKEFGRKCRGGEVFLLIGELGGGKTQFVKGLAQGLGIGDDITSPTFTYENIYQSQNGFKLYHFDLYRLEGKDVDIANLMLESFNDPRGITAIEWAEKAKNLWPKSYYRIEFKWISENEREIKIITKE